ncbi:protein S100-A1 isoform X1 [Tympanuchus pallidicinctus]|uniref:protein S100-A1 isoform X1 n=1 Tax=Tympanuchus pallidicinctus TaxID=109042 RepID=UPI002286EAC1|nr:protein S100-A1 isoform X1 [Tympanuchus pallidicinctus]
MGAVRPPPGSHHPPVPKAARDRGYFYTQCNPAAAVQAMQCQGQAVPEGVAAFCPLLRRGRRCHRRQPPSPQRHVTMASQLEGAMETLINVFHHYSGKEGDKYKLSKKELKELLQSELGCFLETQKDTGAVEKIMQDLDENGDGEVDFQEYVVLVAALTVACNTFFWENA